MKGVGAPPVQQSQPKKSVLSHANLGHVINEQYHDFAAKQEDEVLEDGTVISHLRGETHINSKTGKKRKYSQPDVNPHLKGETSKEEGERWHEINEVNAKIMSEHTEEEAAKWDRWNNATQEERMEIMRHEGDEMTMRASSHKIKDSEKAKKHEASVNERKRQTEAYWAKQEAKGPLTPEQQARKAQMLSKFDNQ